MSFFPVVQNIRNKRFQIDYALNSAKRGLESSQEYSPFSSAAMRSSILIMNPACCLIEEKTRILANFPCVWIRLELLRKRNEYLAELSGVKRNLLVPSRRRSLH